MTHFLFPMVWKIMSEVLKGSLEGSLGFVNVPFIIPVFIEILPDLRWIWNCFRGLDEVSNMELGLGISWLESDSRGGGDECTVGKEFHFS